MKLSDLYSSEEDFQKAQYIHMYTKALHEDNLAINDLSPKYVFDNVKYICMGYYEMYVDSAKYYLEESKREQARAAREYDKAQELKKEVQSIRDKINGKEESEN